MNQKITSILEELKNLTLFEATELVKEMESVFGIDASPIPMTVLSTAAPASTNSTPIQVEEQTAFQVLLTEVPAEKKIAILKIVRNITGLGLKESKDIVDNVPKLLKEGATKEESETIRKDIEALGGKITIK